MVVAGEWGGEGESNSEAMAEAEGMLMEARWLFFLRSFLRLISWAASSIMLLVTRQARLR